MSIWAEFVEYVQGVGWSCLSTWLHLELTKIQTSGYIYEDFLDWIIWDICVHTCTYISFFIHSSIMKTSCFYILTIVNDVSVNIGMWPLLGQADFTSLQCKTRKGLLTHMVAGFEFLMSFHTLFHNGCSSLHPCLLCTRLLLATPPPILPTSCPSF